VRGDAVGLKRPPWGRLRGGREDAVPSCGVRSTMWRGRIRWRTTPLCWPLRSSAPPLLSVPHDETGVIRRSRHGIQAAVSAARANPPAILPRSSSARMSNAASTGLGSGDPEMPVWFAACGTLMIPVIEGMLRRQDEDRCPCGFGSLLMGNGHRRSASRQLDAKQPHL